MIDLTSTKEIGKLLLIGAIIVAGMRAAEWIIPSQNLASLSAFHRTPINSEGAGALPT
ncbi:MAG: hypothetical protein M0R02_12975 [Bacteroidales bacterium]|nr:hypothetical protein [Bacteroidales bacterium]